jgi:hypothetical protein
VDYDSIDSLGSPLETPILQDRAVNSGPGHLRPVAIVQTSGGELVEFYDYRGRLLVSGIHPPSARGVPIHAHSFAHGRTFDAKALWNEASGGAPMPERLAALIRASAVSSAKLDQARAERMTRARAGRAPRSEAPPAQSTPPGDVTAGELGMMSLNGFCKTSYYTTDVSGDASTLPLGTCRAWHWNVCWDNVTGNGGASHSDVSLMHMNVCPYRGAVTVNVSADESGPPTGSWTVSEDTYRWWEYSGGNCDRITHPWDDCPTIRADILNAENDGYNFRYSVYDW